MRARWYGLVGLTLFLTFENAALPDPSLSSVFTRFERAIAGVIIQIASSAAWHE